MDNIPVTGRIMKQLMMYVLCVFEAWWAHRITLLAAKATIGKSVKFAGIIVDKDRNKPDLVKVGALKDFPAPKDLTNLNNNLRLANQLGEFTPNLKHSLEPLKPLISAKNAYLWKEALQKAFKKSKNVLK